MIKRRLSRELYAIGEDAFTDMEPIKKSYDLPCGRSADYFVAPRTKKIEKIKPEKKDPWLIPETAAISVASDEATDVILPVYKNFQESKK